MAHMGGVVCGGGGRSFACSDQRSGTDVGERRRETVRHLPASLLTILLTQHSPAFTSFLSSLCRDSIATIFVALIMKPHTLTCAPQQ
jgi:hypothetical protein